MPGYSPLAELRPTPRGARRRSLASLVVVATTAGMAAVACRQLPRDLDRRPCPLAGDTRDDRNAFGRAGYAAERGDAPTRCTVCLRRRPETAIRAPWSPRMSRRLRQHAAGRSSASPGAGGPPCGSTDCAGAVMLPTNLCLLTSTYEKPHPAHHPAWMRRGASCFTDSRPASEDRTRSAAEPLTPPSPSRAPAPSARAGDDSIETAKLVAGAVA